MDAFSTKPEDKYLYENQQKLSLAELDVRIRQGNVEWANAIKLVVSFLEEISKPEAFLMEDDTKAEINQAVRVIREHCIVKPDNEAD